MKSSSDTLTSELERCLTISDTYPNLFKEEQRDCCAGNLRTIQLPWLQKPQSSSHSVILGIGHRSVLIDALIISPQLIQAIYLFIFNGRINNQSSANSGNLPLHLSTSCFLLHPNMGRVNKSKQKQWLAHLSAGPEVVC